MVEHKTNLTANPRTLRLVSWLPLAPAALENRIVMGVVWPTGEVGVKGHAININSRPSGKKKEMKSLTSGEQIHHGIPRRIGGGGGEEAMGAGCFPGTLKYLQEKDERVSE